MLPEQTTAVILVAGLGSRLGAMTQSQPKCLTNVNGTVILDNALQALEGVGVPEVVLVTGYLSNVIQRHFESSTLAVKVHYAHNASYSDTGTSASLRCALNEISAGKRLLIIEGDVFFEVDLLRDLLECEQDATAVARYNPNLSGTFVTLRPDGALMDWLHESQRPANFDVQSAFKTINITSIVPRSRNALDDCLDQTIFEFGMRAPLEYCMRCMLRNGAQILGIDCSERRWVEIDDQRDLRLAERIFS